MIKNLEDKIKNILNSMEESIKANDKDEKELIRIQAIKDYINGQNEERH